MKIRLWGVRGSLPVPGLQTVRYGGSGLRPLGEHLIREPPGPAGEPLVCHMLFGHAHWDHIQGFPFFAPAYMAGNIIHLYTAAGASRRLDEALSGQQEFTYFPVKFTDMSATIVNHDIGDENLTIGDVLIRHTALNHPGGCLGYRLEEGDHSFVYLSDHEPYLRLLDSPTFRLGLRSEGLSLEQATARAEADDQRVLEFARGADVLIADAAYTEEEYAKKIGWGHSSVDEVVRRALAAEAKTLVLSHHDMGHSDEQLDQLAEHARELVRQAGRDLECVVGSEGLAIEL